jgi:ceramide glucosyltransferase
MADAASRAVLDSSLHSFSLLSALDPRGMVGKLVAIRSEALARVGGFGGLTAYLGEDMELARRLRAAGLRVAASAVPAACAPGRRSWRQTLGRYARWIAVIRAQRPALLATYPLLIAAAPLQLGLALLALVTEKAGALPALLAVVGGRWVVAAAARWRSERRLSPASTAWLADVVLLAAWLRAMVSPSVTWRGVQFRVRPGGMLTEVAR